MTALASNPLESMPRAMSPDLQGASLMDSARRRDPAALEALVRAYGPRMLAVARRMLRCEHDAADALQDAFISMMRSIDQFREESNVGTWLHRVIINVCLMKMRSRSRERATIDRWTADRSCAAETHGWREPVDQCDNLTREETARRVRDCIDQLPEPYRIVLTLRDLEQLDTATTARMVGCSVANVKTRLHRARLALSTRLASADTRREHQVSPHATPR